MVFSQITNNQEDTKTKTFRKSNAQEEEETYSMYENTHSQAEPKASKFKTSLQDQKFLDKINTMGLKNEIENSNADLVDLN